MSEKANAEIDRAKLRILVVEDREQDLKNFQMVLANLGYQSIDAALNPTSAYEMCLELRSESQFYDLIISDWSMPGGITGLDFLRKIRSNSSFANTPFLMVSANRGADYLEAATKFGVTDYLLKPFEEADLDRKILKALSAAKPTD